MLAHSFPTRRSSDLDQKQHLELARNVADRFNKIYGDVFVVPEGYFPKVGARVMSLQEPTRKMSKSDENQNAYVSLKDDPDTVMRKFRRAVTDSEAQVRYAEGKDGINNLMEIYSACTGDSLEAIEAAFAGKGYGDFKQAVGEAVVEVLRPIQERFARYMQDKGQLDFLMKQGAERASLASRRTLDKAMKKMGFVLV